MKKVIILVTLVLSLLSFTAFAQEGLPDSESKEVIQRLSYENFRDIKLLMTAIHNYGGGEEEFSTLVDSYSEASALYFSKEYEKSAKMFQENEKHIREVATKLAETYKKDSEELQKEIIKKNVKTRIKKELNGEKANPSQEKYLNQSASAVILANDYYERSRPIQAIELYRLSNEKLVNYLYLEASELPQETIDECRKDMYTYDQCIKKAKNEARSKVDEEYDKVIKDYNNEVYESKEKEN